MATASATPSAPKHSDSNVLRNEATRGFRLRGTLQRTRRGASGATAAGGRQGAQPGPALTRALEWRTMSPTAWQTARPLASIDTARPYQRAAPFSAELPPEAERLVKISQDAMRAAAVLEQLSRAHNSSPAFLRRTGAFGPAADLPRIPVFSFRCTARALMFA